jgi:hypothetical protein
MGDWEERSGDFWQHDTEGDSIEGKLVAVREGQYGPIYDVEDADGKITTVGSSTVLKNRITPNDVGKEIRVVFDGLQASKIKGRNATKLYKVFFRK